MDNYIVYTYEISGVDQESIVDAYEKIVHGINVSKNAFLDFFQYTQFLNKYCKTASIDGARTSLIVNVKIGKEVAYDLVDLQYLVQLILKLRKSQVYKVVLLVFDTDDGNYYRISQALRLWYIFHADKNSIWFRINNPRYKNIKIQRLAIKNGAFSSKVMPLCQLSPDIWKVFSVDCIASEEECIKLDEFYDLFSQLAQKQGLSQTQILEIIQDTMSENISEAELFRLTLSRYVYDKNRKNASKFSKSNCLTQFIFALYLANRVDPKSIEASEIDTIHEVCASYAQGITQIIENSIIHPPKESVPYSFFSFRANIHPDRLKKYIKEPENIYSLLEFSVSDISLNEEKALGITDSFVRRHPKYSSVTLNDFYEFKYDNKENVLWDYYSNAANAVTHFGLQIFANAVRAYNGCFNVTSLNSEPYFISGKKYAFNNVLNKCFLGTTYSVILPLEKTIQKTESYKTYSGENSLEATISALDTADELYELKDIPVALNDKQISIFEQSNELQQYISNFDIVHSLWGSPSNYSVRISSDNVNSIINYCKAVFIQLLSKKNIKNIVLFFDDNEDFLLAVRTCCLFYDRVGQCNLIAEKKGILLYNLTNKTEAYFYGTNLSSVLGGLSNQYVNGLMNHSAYNQIETIFGHQLTEYTGFGNYCNDIAIKLLVNNPDTNKYLIEEELFDVLNNDIHDRNIGCKISQTHFRVSKVHLDTYYEAQFLFGNSYWCKVFATYLAYTIKKAFAKENRIIIYGYEKYSAETLAVARTLLVKLGYETVHLLFFENGDPELDSNRVRFVESLPDGKYDICYFVGISSTLSTFNQMNRALDSVIIEKELAITPQKVVCTSIVQIVENLNDDKLSHNHTEFKGKEPLNLISVSEKEHVVSNSFIDFSTNKQASFLVSIAANWYKPENCKYCLTGEYYKKPYNYKTERPLIEVDETSVIPTLLYRLNDESSEQINTIDYNYLEKLRERNFVYAEHLKRKGNHYQYFLRLAHIYTAHKAEIIDWLESIKENEDFKRLHKVWSNNTSINIIISPQQNSSNGFVDDVNQVIFGGRAHTIVFDIRKEYRKTFAAKYSFLKEHLEGKRLRFFYVADHIIAGTTYNRTQSLVSTLFGKKVPVFSGVFVLANRHSKKSQRTLLGIPSNKKPIFLPYFSFINLSIPSLRQHNCPACKKVSQYETALRDSATVKVAFEFQQRILLEREKTLKEIHDLYGRKHRSATEEEKRETQKRYEYNSDKLFIENQLWEFFLETKHPTIDDLIHNMDGEFHYVRKDILSQITNSDEQKIYLNNVRIKKLGILIDVIISPMLIYQENVKTLSLGLVRYIYDELLSFFINEVQGQYLSEFDIDCKLADKNELKVLFEATIRGLCYLGSAQFLSPDKIADCLAVYSYGTEERNSFEKRLISYIKFMVSNDKIKEFSFDDKGNLSNDIKPEAKSNILIENIRKYYNRNCKTKDWKDNIAFWRLLYIESVSTEVPELVECAQEELNVAETGESDNNEVLNNYAIESEHTDASKNLPPKYKKYIQTIKETSGFELDQIGLFVKVKGGYYNLANFSKFEPDLRCKNALAYDGYYFDETKNDWYFLISNNIDLIDNKTVPNKIIRELIGTTEVHAIIKISFNDIPNEDQLESVRKILLYKNNLLHMLEDDYEEEFFARSYELEKIKRSTRNTLGFHGKVNWNEYQFVLDALVSNKMYNEFYDLMDIFRNAFISFANLSTVLSLNPKNIVVMFNPHAERLDCALSVVNIVVDYFRKEKNLNIEYNRNIDLGDKNYKFIMFGQSPNVGYFGLGVFAYIFLENAFKHADRSQPITLSIKRSEDNNLSKDDLCSFDMELKNTKSPTDAVNSSVTMSALTNLFDIIRKENPLIYTEVKESDPTENEYKVKLTNIIMEVKNKK